MTATPDERMVVAASRMTYTQIGFSPPRPDGDEKVTGAARYGADIHLPGMLIARFVRSPHVHARIKHIDVQRALAHPGVRAVLTGADFPMVESRLVAMGETSVDVLYLQDLVMAHDTVKWRGHPVAAVAAVDAESADEAVALITVEYELLPAINDIETAMQPGAPVIRGDLRTRSIPTNTYGDQPTNIATHIVRTRGSVIDGFALADVIVEREFRTVMVHQGYIEPQSCTVDAKPDGTVTIWTTTQGAFKTRETVSELLMVPQAQIRVVPMEVGGAFGGKIYPYLEPVGLLLSRMAGAPVKLTMSRTEVMLGTGPSPGSISRIKLGATRDGDLVAATAWFAYEAGAAPGSPVGRACLCGLSSYRIPHFRIEGFDVLLNRPRVTAYRAPGATQATYACEQVIDELAQQLDMDPLAFRLRNASREGDPRTDGVLFNGIGLTAVLEAARKHPAWTSPPPQGPGQGRGAAIGFWINYGGTSACEISLAEDGTVDVLTGSVDITNSRVAMAQIAAEELGVDVRTVRSRVGDTESVGFTELSGGSRTTFATGAAVRAGALALQEELRRRAALMLEVDPADLVCEQGRFAVVGAPAAHVTVAQIAARQQETGGPLHAQGNFTGNPAAPAFGLHIADVEVDPDTGKVTILRYTAFQDVGRAIHPMAVEGQMQGGVAQGVGWALSEGYAWADGVLQNTNLLDYKLPVSLDLPDIDCVIIEVPSADHPYGVRGAGEVPIVPPPATIANAISRATGFRHTQLPMNPQRVWETCAQLESR